MHVLVRHKAFTASKLRIIDSRLIAIVGVFHHGSPFGC